MNDKQRAKVIAKAIVAVSSDTVIPRKDEELFGILFARHLLSNGGHEVDPDLLILSMRDAFHELNHWKEGNPNTTVETVFRKEYVDELIKKGWYRRRKENLKIDW
mgnify:FL=1